MQFKSFKISYEYIFPVNIMAHVYSRLIFTLSLQAFSKSHFSFGFKALETGPTSIMIYF